MSDPVLCFPSTDRLFFVFDFYGLDCLEPVNKLTMEVVFSLSLILPVVMPRTTAPMQENVSTRKPADEMNDGKHT